MPSEIEFWRQIISGTHPTKAWVQEMRDRAAGRLTFPAHLHRYLSKDGTARVLDVGSGPVTTLGTPGAPHPVEIVAVDPLADTYNFLLDQYGLTLAVRTLNGEGERLSEFGLGLFDLVYSRSALDHAYDPLRVIREMVAVCKPAGAVFFEGSVNESVKQNGHGLHQCNFMPWTTISSSGSLTTQPFRYALR